MEKPNPVLQLPLHRCHCTWSWKFSQIASNACISENIWRGLNVPVRTCKLMGGSLFSDCSWHVSWSGYFHCYMQNRSCASHIKNPEKPQQIVNGNLVLASGISHACHSFQEADPVSNPLHISHTLRLGATCQCQVKFVLVFKTQTYRHHN